MQADVSIESDVVRLFETVDEQLGSVGALVNNAAIVLPQMRVEDMQASRINQILSTNITSAFLCCREAVKRMSFLHGGQGGSIVNVSSAASRIGAAGEYVDYAASKGAIDTLTKGLSLEVAAEGLIEKSPVIAKESIFKDSVPIFKISKMIPVLIAVETLPKSIP